MLLLDLFCGAGGATRGYKNAGFDVIGVDNAKQKNYPSTFFLGDWYDVALEILNNFSVDAIHASPPCQAYSDLRTKQTTRQYPKLIEPVRDFLQSTGLPYVIENVDNAPLVNPIKLCGAMFPPLRVYRHRLFESNIDLVAPEHPKHVARTYTYDRRKKHFGQPLTKDMFVQVTGGGNAPHALKLEAMGIDWRMNRKEVNEAIPPAYTEFIGRQLCSHIDAGTDDDRN